MDHFRWIIHLPSKRDRRQIRCVGLDQQAIQRHTSCNLLQFLRALKGHNPRKRDVKPQIHRLTCNFPGLCKAVHHAARILGTLLTHNRDRIGRRRPRMDNQGQTGLTRCTNMGPKPFTLPGEIALQAKIVQPRLTNCDNFWMAAVLHQEVNIGLYGILIIGMNTNRCPEGIMPLNDIHQSRPVRQIHAYTQGM